MFHIYQDDNDIENKRNIEKQSVINERIPTTNFLSNNDANETNSLKSESPSSFINPPSPTFFLQNFTFNSFPSLDYIVNKQTQIKNKSLRFIKVTNDLCNKINLLEEIYEGPEYKRLKMSNKLIECHLDEEASHKLVARLITKLNNDDTSLFDRTVHPAYSTEEQDEEQAMDSSGMFKVPSTPALVGDFGPGDMSHNETHEVQNHDQDQPVLFTADMDMVTEEAGTTTTTARVVTGDSLFLEHEGNTYIQVDDTNYHLVRSLSEDGIVITETGLEITVPPGTEVPMPTTAYQQETSYYQPQQNPPQPQYTQQQQHYNQPQQHIPMIDQSHFYREYKTPVPRKNVRNDLSSFFGHYPGGGGEGTGAGAGNTVKPYSDYVALPLRPAPQTPFTLSSQLYTPELSISLTEQECELMLTIDSAKRTLPQQTPIYYQIYSYKDEDRYAKPTSEVWGLVGEIKACPLPMFCTISIPSGYHKHYFAIRSVDEFSRFSDWSNVVQVEVENTQHLTNKR